jgi:hypothetical protein
VSQKSEAIVPAFRAQEMKHGIKDVEVVTFRGSLDTSYGMY